MTEWVRAAPVRTMPRALQLWTMANPEELRRRDQQLPKPQRKYPRSRVTQVMWILIAVVVAAAIIGGL